MLESEKVIYNSIKDPKAKEEYKEACEILHKQGATYEEMKWAMTTMKKLMPNFKTYI